MNRKTKLKINTYKQCDSNSSGNSMESFSTAKLLIVNNTEMN